MHPALAAHPAPRRVLVLGGGDGLAVREILRYPAVQSVTLVDLDREVTRLFTDNPLLVRSQRRRAARSAGAHRQRRRLHLADQHARRLRRRRGRLPRSAQLLAGQAVLAQLLPDAPRGDWPRAAWRWCRRPRRCSRGGRSGASPRRCAARGWCRVPTTSTCRPSASGASSWPAGRLDAAAAYPAGLRFLTVEATPALFAFPPDMAAVPVEVNRLDNQILVQYYGAEWQRISRQLVEMGGPEMAPHTPPALRAPRRSRDARRC